MKLLVKICLILSIMLNVYFVIDEKKWASLEYFGEAFNNVSGGKLSATSWELGWELFHSNLIKKDSSLARKKYYYVNIWTSTCKPCIREMPWLDTLALKTEKDVGYFFVTDMSESSAGKFIEGLQFKPKRFTFMHNMNDFVSAACAQMKMRSKIYPMTLILNNKGQLLFSAVGGYSNPNEALKFTELISKLD